MTTDQKLDEILSLLRAIKLQPQAQPTQVSAVADDADLDGPKGDPEIKTLVPTFKWPGAQHKGERMSQTMDPAYLLVLAGHLEWAAAKSDLEGKTWTSPKSGEEFALGDFNRRDAARARGWAQRIKDGKVVKDTVTVGDLF